MWGFIRFGCNTLWLGGGNLQNKTPLLSSQWKVNHRGRRDIAAYEQPLQFTGVEWVFPVKEHTSVKDGTQMAVQWENCRSTIHLRIYFFGDWQWCETFRLPLSHWSQAMLRIKKVSLYFTYSMCTHKWNLSSAFSPYLQVRHECTLTHIHTYICMQIAGGSHSMEPGEKEYMRSNWLSCWSNTS